MLRAGRHLDLANAPGQAVPLQSSVSAVHEGSAKHGAQTQRSGSMPDNRELQVASATMITLDSVPYHLRSSWFLRFNEDHWSRQIGSVRT